MTAERDTTDRYLAAYLSERVGTELTGRISGVARFGAFVRLDETGADGLIPIRSLGGEYFHFDREGATLMGADSGMIVQPGQRVTVKLAEAAPVTGGLQLELIEHEGETVKQRPGGRGFGRGRSKGKGPSAKRKLVKAKRKDAKTKKKLTRRGR